MNRGQITAIRLLRSMYFNTLTINLAASDLFYIPRTYLNMASKNHEDIDSDTAVSESKPELKEPGKYKVILLNDDYTPMEFVVEVLQSFFNLDREAATRVMLNVHTKGQGICGVYTRDIAETKVHLVNQCSRENQHPLLCTMEAED